VELTPAIRFATLLHGDQAASAASPRLRFPRLNDDGAEAGDQG
jgi:hypothetical protein